MKMLKKWSIIGLLACIQVIFAPLMAQTLTIYEYWLDNQTPVSQTVNQTTQEVMLSDSADIRALSVGLHTFNIRFKNDSLWSSVTSQYFFKTDAQVADGQLLCEYWFNDAITTRRSSAFQTTPNGDNLIILDSLDVRDLENGLHQFHVRFVNGVGLSSISTSYFYKQSSNRSDNDLIYEYWLDDSISNPRTRTFAATAAEMLLLDSIALTGVSTGLHAFNIRFLNGVGRSSIQTHYFYKTTGPVLSGEVVYEYWLDDSIGGRQTRTVRTTSNGADLIVLDSLSLNGLATGLHRLNVRWLDGMGRSSVQSHSFYKLPAGTVGDILCEYWFDGDLTRRRSKPMSSTGIETLVLLDSLDASNLCRGQHVLQTRFFNANGWSCVQQDTFIKNTAARTMPYADFSFRMSPDSYTVYFADSSLNATTHRWDFGDGSFDDIQMNPAHRYTNPGVYQVCRKIGNPNTFPCQTDSICKTVTIRGISDLYPKRVANTIQNIINISGFGFTRNATVQFVQGNQIVNVDSFYWTNDRSIRTDVLFSNAMTGRWTLRMIQGNDTFRLQDTLTVEPLQSHNLAITIEGPPSVLINREFDYKVTVRNRSNVTAFAIPLLIEVDAKKKVRLMNVVNYKNPLIADSTINRVKDTTGFLTFRDTITNDSIKYASYFIPFIRSDATYTILFKVKAVETSATKIRATVAAPFGDTSTLRRVDVPISRRELSPQGICDFPFLSPCQNAVKDLALEGVGNIPSPIGFAAKTFGIICTVGDAVADWRANGNLTEDHFGLIPIATDVLGAFVVSRLGPPPPPKTMAYKSYSTAKAFTKNAFGAAGFGVGMAAAAKKVSDECSKKPDVPPAKQETTPTVRASSDPNLKVGPIGKNALNCVHVEDFMPFTIYYENADSATAPASEVYVIDTLDRTKFDISTFRFTEFAFGDSIYYLQTAAKSFVRDIDMRPRKNIILRVSGDLDSTGIVQWSFKSFDPHTMDLTQNIDDGFLPPNRRKPEGEGRVGYTIRLNTTLPHLTTIRNIADIIFDGNAPIRTPVWINTVDRVAPTSRVVSITPTSRDSVIMVRWAGNDSHAGILDYTIYVAENNGAFQPWIEGLSSDSALFIGKRGFQYAFYSIARDYVGNIESKTPRAEGIGRVGTGELVKKDSWLGQNRPNPALQQTQIDFYLVASSQKVRLEVYNLAGIKVKTAVNNAFPAGLHTITIDLKGLATGIYFYRLETDAFSETKRMLIVE